MLHKSKWKLALLLLFAFCYALPVFAQTKQANTAFSPNIFFELGGNGILFSLNYDQRFSNTNQGLGGRVGVGYLPSFTSERTASVILPLAVNYLTGGPHSFEAGAGVTVGFNKWTGNEVVFVPSAGYRYQPDRKGFTFRIFVSPLIGDDISEGGTFWGGLSLGMRF